MAPKSTARQLACAAALLAAAGPAQAFDYWRLDFGYSASTKSANFGDKDFSTDGLMCADAACTSGAKIDEAGHAGVFGGGVGWNLKNDWRVDLTATYRTGYELSKLFADNTSIKADVTSASAFANLYKDFSLSWGRPYVGAGVGVSQNRVDEMQGSFNGASFTAPGGRKTSYVYSLMAGFGVPLSGSMVLDIGYRFVDLGELVTNEGNLTGSLTGHYTGASGKLQANEITIGLRF